MKIGWRFPPLAGGNKQGYTNNDIEGFKGEELMNNLAREICQNSLDAHDNSNSKPVKVVFELKQVETKNYNVFSEYSKCLEGCRKFWSRGGVIDAKLDAFLKEAQTTIEKPQINVLVASDYNTKGLIGNHDLDNISTSWEALTGAEGTSVKSDENSAGSFGIGKNAPFACSSLSMVFYNTFDMDNNKAFIGVGKLATLLNDEGKPTQRVGRYQKNDDINDKWIPIYEEDYDLFKDQFTRTEKGTDIIIVGFSETENWEENIIKAVIKNFFVAIQENRLVVEIRKSEKITKSINDVTISNMIEQYSKEDKTSEITRQLYEAFVKPDNHVFRDILGEENAIEIYVKSESSYSRSIANFRSTGMLVGEGSRRIFQHYAAVLIVRGRKLEELLRACEPPRHNRWDYKIIKGESEKQKRLDAKRALDDINNEVLNILKAQYEIPAGDSIDAVGVSAYLPDMEDELATDGLEGLDALRVDVKIGKTRIPKSLTAGLNLPGENSEGQEANGDTWNKRVRPHHPPLPGPGPGPGPRPKPDEDIEPAADPMVNISDSEKRRGVKQGNGERIITVRELTKRRVYPLSVDRGLYRIVIIPTQNYDKLFVECQVAGEDGSADNLKINKFMYQGKSVECNGGKAGPVSVIKDVTAEFNITFDRQEKMGLNLILTEGGN